MDFACFDAFLFRWGLLCPSSIGGVGRPDTVMYGVANRNKCGSRNFWSDENSRSISGKASCPPTRLRGEIIEVVI
jgi:hypothetical protein